MKSAPKLREIASHFEIQGTFVHELPCPQGMVNETHRVVFDSAGNLQSYVLQKLNSAWFKEPDTVMHNIHRVSCHLAKKLQCANLKEISQRVLTIIPCKTGQLYLQHQENEVWRCFVYVHTAKSIEHTDDPRVINRVARAIAGFHDLLVDLPGPPLVETNQTMNDTHKLLKELYKAIKADPLSRVEGALNEIAWVEQREWLANIWPTKDAHKEFPERIVHHDAKITNILIDPNSIDGECIVDLDTVGPGLVLFDFGNLVRSTTISNPHGASNLESVYMRLQMFDSLTNGYLSVARSFISNLEIQLLAISGNVSTFNVAIHYLADHFNGDILHKPKRPNHNLDRFRLHRRLLESMESQQKPMDMIVSQYARNIL